MGGSLSFAKTILIPASISLGIYVLSYFAIIPLVRRYRQRYTQYLPLHTISAHTSTLRDRLSDALMNFMLPSSWRRNRLVEGQEDGGSLFDDEEGEGMVGFDMDPARRDALDRGRDMPQTSEGRLSRELEEGFMDDSDGEDNNAERQSNIINR